MDSDILIASANCSKMFLHMSVFGCVCVCTCVGEGKRGGERENLRNLEVYVFVKILF